MNKACIFISAIFLTIGSSLKAQTDFSLRGLGRVIVSHDKLGGNLVKGDSATPIKGMGGYILFDLQPTLKVNDNIRANAILRVKQQFGSFFGDGTAFEFRQFQVMGKIGKYVDYHIGDINVEMTPYTVFAFPEMYHQFESEIFQIRRSVVNYENFVIGNAWRLQGVQGFAKLPVLKGIDVNAFGVRTNPTNDVLTPDRILAGTRAVLKATDMIHVGANYVGMLDIPIESANVNYTNHVITGEAKFLLDLDAVNLTVKGETGMSDYEFVKVADNQTVGYNDFFYDVNAGAVLKPVKLKLFAGYRDVGPQFSSPSAQTRRINIGMNPLLFPQVMANSVDRGQVLFDRFTQEGIYNRGVNPVLFPFNPAYNNIFPYGDATPNRKGITTGIASDTSLKVISAELRADLFSEIIGEGIKDLRKFLGVRGGFVLDISKLAGISSRSISLNAGLRYEKTTRDGFAPIDFTSTLIDGGLVVEVFKRFDILGGVKMLNAKGNEYLAVRDEFNLLSSFPPVTIDLTQVVFSGGARIRFANNSYFTVNYNVAPNKTAASPSTNYDIRQLFFNYTLIIP
ncbi:MAG: hypothetical protein K2X86_02920 [Cytophagaceae bacterium]|nr:hypothetical protein [Cytophagaceae bacterium]